METRENAGYTITDNIWVGNKEFVLGERDTPLGVAYVTWESNGKDNYYWGNYYMQNHLAAVRNLLERTTKELTILEHKERKIQKEKRSERE